MNMSVVGSTVQGERSEKSDIVISEIPQDQWYIIEVGYLVDTIDALALHFQRSRRSFAKTGKTYSCFKIHFLHSAVHNHFNFVHARTKLLTM